MEQIRAFLGHTVPSYSAGSDAKLKLTTQYCWPNDVRSSAAAYLYSRYRLVGLVVKASASNPACDGILSGSSHTSDLKIGQNFSGSSHTSDLKTGTPVATLPVTWRYRVSAGTGLPGISTLWLGEVERLICSFCLQQHVRINCPWDTLACCWDVRHPTNNPLTL